MNLVLCLLSTRRFLTAGQIARIVPGYEHDDHDPRAHEAFQRMFERDKAELRDLGVPLETGTTSAFETEPGYRIAQRDYALPEVHLAPEEAAAVGLAAQLWHQAGLASAASSGLLKLRAGGVEVEPPPTLGIEPVVGAEPALEPVLAAIHARRAVRFGYRTPHEDEPRVRRLQPWGAVSWRGRWYVVGHDLDRDATRCFRLSRVAGQATPFGPAGAFTPPDGVDLLAQVVAAHDDVPGPPAVARIRLRPGTGAGLRRWADTVAPDAEGWDGLTLTFHDPEALAARLAGYGSAVVVLDPPEVRAAVVRRLARIAGVPEPAGAGPPAGDRGTTP